MSNLELQQQNNSFSGLLQIPGGVTRELQQVQDGNGQATGLWLSSGGTSATTSDTYVASEDGVAIPNAVVRRISDGFGDYLSVKDFGAVGDGVTDDTTAIQNAINAAIYNNGSTSEYGLKFKVFMPAGIYLISDTLQLGYGITQNAVVLEGSGPRYYYNLLGGDEWNGTAIVADFSDRPAVNFQGCTVGSAIKNLSLIGKLSAWIVSNNLGTTGALIDDTVPSAWDDPSLASTQDSRYAPYAGISVDAYCGTRPATSYPNINYPSFLGSVPQYGKQQSSAITIENVNVYGFTVAVVNQPSDFDANGDFTKVKNCVFEYCKWGISVGNSQSRNVSIDGLQCGFMYCILTNNTHGKQIGKFGGTVTDLSAYDVIQLFSFRSYYASPMVFNTTYGESIYRLGDLQGTSADESAFIFNGCEFSFTGQSDTKGYPATILSSAQIEQNIVFNGCTFDQYNSVAVFDMLGVSFNYCYFWNFNRTNTYEKLAHNHLAGGLVMTRFTLPKTAILKTQPYSLTSGVKTGITSNTQFLNSSFVGRDYCIPLYTQNVGTQGDVLFKNFPFVNTIGLFGVLSKADSSPFVSTSISGRTLTIQVNASYWRGTGASLVTLGGVPGDVILDVDTNTVFFIRSYDSGTNTILAEAQNNYISNGSGGYQLISAYNTSVGYLYVKNSRLYSPTQYLKGDITYGSAIVTNVARDDGYAFYASEILANDAMYVDPYTDNWSSNSSVINSVDAVAKTITLAGTVAKTQTSKQLQLFVRTPPANV